jgi:hypothetical protein
VAFDFFLWAGFVFESGIAFPHAVFAECGIELDSFDEFETGVADGHGLERDRWLRGFLSVTVFFAVPVGFDEAASVFFASLGVEFFNLRFQTSIRRESHQISLKMA